MLMTNRKQNIYVQIALWIEDNPDPPLDEAGRLMREYVNDFAESGFTVEEIAEARRIYRRDYQFLKRNFGFLWECCKNIWEERHELATPGEAWMITIKLLNSLYKPEHPWLITPEMVMEFTPSLETAKRIAAIVKKYHWTGIFTDNQAADRARFIDAYKLIDHKMTNDSTWKTPDNLLPEGAKTVAQLAKNIGKETSIDRK